MTPSDKPDAADALEARIVELEVALTYQRETIGALDEVIQGMHAQMARLHRRMDALEEGEGATTSGANDGA